MSVDKALEYVWSQSIKAIVHLLYKCFEYKCFETFFVINQLVKFWLISQASKHLYKYWMIRTLSRLRTK